MTSLISIVSPTLTFHATISASVRPSPTSGRRNSDITSLSVRERAVDGVEHAVEVGEVLLLDARRRVGRVERADAQDRGLEGVEALLGDPGRELRAHAEVDVRLVGDHAATGATYGLVDRGHVEWREGAQVDDLEAAALGLGSLGALERGLHGRAVGQHRRVGARSDHARGEERLGRRRLVELRLVGVVLTLGLEEDDRVV